MVQPSSCPHFSGIENLEKKGIRIQCFCAFAKNLFVMGGNQKTLIDVFFFKFTNMISVFNEKIEVLTNMMSVF